ncbi:hypothetical protein Asi03nite_48830 [Actinoplanes siamensis]|uniref:Uncharacterized protein n=1 Tax=Actinoplanes siamensis TaxID=1223317 RepID=A0A919TMS7_9ACTN|nr:hypothetical protein Asi03nite_48830 [Actinoplanes siamensis]
MPNPPLAATTTGARTTEPSATEIVKAPFPAVTRSIEPAAVEAPEFAIPAAGEQPTAGTPVAIPRGPVQLALPFAEPRPRSLRVMPVTAPVGNRQTAENPTRLHVERE